MTAKSASTGRGACMVAARSSDAHDTGEQRFDEDGEESSNGNAGNDRRWVQRHAVGVFRPRFIQDLLVRPKCHVDDLLDQRTGHRSKLCSQSSQPLVQPLDYCPLVPECPVVAREMMGDERLNISTEVSICRVLKTGKISGDFDSVRTHALRVLINKPWYLDTDQQTQSEHDQSEVVRDHSLHL